LGESDGRGLNATAVESRKTGRVMPLRENPGIYQRRTGLSGPPALNEAEHHSEQVLCSKVEGVSKRRRSLHGLAEFAKNLFKPALVRKILVVSEFDPESRLFKNIYYSGVAGRVEKFYYDQHYHSSGHEAMCRALVQKCGGFRPDLIVFIPPVKDIYLSPEEKVAPGEEIFEAISRETGARLLMYDPGKHGRLAADPLGHFDQGLARDIDVCFWGSVPAGGKREEYINYLRENGVQVCTRNYRVGTERYSQILNRSKIALGLGKDGEVSFRLDSRALDILSSGCLLLQEGNIGELGPEVDYVPFPGKEELLEKIRHYLDNPGKRQAIARTGHDRVKREGGLRSFWAGELSGMGFRRSCGVYIKLVNIAVLVAKKILSRWLRPLLIRVLPTRYVYYLKALARRLHLDLA
ncbi:MAG: glycosyltransferase family protein, partial [Desulfocucumaceae bacterium]